MHLQKKKYLTFDLVTRNVAQYPLHHVTYSAGKLEVATSKGLGGNTFTRNTLFDLYLGVKVTQNVDQYPLHHVTYSATKSEDATSKGFGVNTFTRNVTDTRTDGPTLVRN